MREYSDIEFNMSLDIEFTTRVLNNCALPIMTNGAVSVITGAVSAIMCVPVDDILSRTRCHMTTLARHTCFYAINDIMGITDKDIGGYFDRARDSVYYGINKARAILDTNDSRADTVRAALVMARKAFDAWNRLVEEAGVSVVAGPHMTSVSGSIKSTPN